MAETFRLNEPHVACEMLEGDIILVHFDSGMYYHLRGIGAAICEYLLAGGSLTQSVQALADHFGIERERVRADASRFVEGLIRDGLMVEGDVAASTLAMNISAPAYEPPSCQKFDDMADQLLLDKIDDPSQNAQWTPGLDN